jgi:hypothetical protein
MGIPPWHMWGNSIQVDLAADGSPSVQNQQLATINYARPESWSFFFGAELLSVSGAPAADCRFHVAFDILPGVGRSVFQTLNGTPLFTPPQDLAFCTMNFLVPAGSLPVGNIVTKRWTTSVRSPKLDDDDATSRMPIDVIVAQNLNVQAAISQSTGGPNIGARFQLTAFFAPRVHVRPEWAERRFPGGETEGH